MDSQMYNIFYSITSNITSFTQNLQYSNLINILAHILPTPTTGYVKCQFCSSPFPVKMFPSSIFLLWEKINGLVFPIERWFEIGKNNISSNRFKWNECQNSNFYFYVPTEEIALNWTTYYSSDDKPPTNIILQQSSFLQIHRMSSIVILYSNHQWYHMEPDHGTKIE